MADNLDLPPSNDRNAIVAGVTNVLPNLDTIEANFEAIEAVINAINLELVALMGGGATNASELLVDRSAFDQLLKDFTGTQAQQLFDFIDGLDLLANFANITSYSTSLSGFVASLTTALDTVKTVSYSLTLPDEFTKLNAVLNGITVNQDLPLTGTGTDIVLDIPVGVRSNILATSQAINGEIVSFLRGTLSDGRTLTSPTVTLTEGAAPVIPFVYTGLIAEGDNVAAFQFDNATRVEIVDNKATFTIPVNNIPPTEDPPGPFGVFAIPADLFVTSLISTAIGVNEVNSWPFLGQIASNGQQFAIHGAGPLVLGATFTYEGTFRT